MPIMPRLLPARDVVGRGQSPQRQDEQHAGDEIGERCEIGFHARAHFFSFFLYIASMRLVTGSRRRCSPGQDQREEAEALEIQDALPSAGTDTAISAPTTITEEMALVTLISGVCSAGVTLQTTK